MVVFLIVGGVQYLRGRSVPASTSSLVSESFQDPNQIENQAFLTALKNLERVSLDGTILSSALFTGLVDFSVELKDQPKGRLNPFKPIDLNERDLGFLELGANANSTGLNFTP